MLLTCALMSSLSFPYLVVKIFFARKQPSELNGRALIMDLTSGSTSSFRYENFVIGDVWNESISALNWFQNSAAHKYYKYITSHETSRVTQTNTGDR